MSQQVIEQFNKMTALCNKMEEIGKIEPSSLDNMVENIDNTAGLLTTIEKLLSTNASGSDVKSAFLGYHIVRNLNLVLAKMKQRYINAKEANDNPVVAEDSLSILPVMSESIEVAMKYAGKKITDGEEEVLLSHINALREITSEVKMKLSSEEESKTISASPEAVLEEEQRLSNAVRQRYAKEEDIY